MTAPTDAHPGVYVLGMHRSGTSAVTALLSFGGLRVCRPEDLYDQVQGNAKGHWESQTMASVNEAVLRGLGGDWARPPALPSGWVADSGAGLLVDRCRETFDAQHPQGPWLWKDPRLCLTLDLWREVHGPVPCVLVLRHPLDVARSLNRRNGTSIAHGLALWERHLRSALSGCRGRTVLVVDLDDAMRDPAGWVQRAVTALAPYVRDLVPTPAPEAARFVDASLWHRTPLVDRLLFLLAASPSQRRLHSLSRRRSGLHERFDLVPSFAETPGLQRGCFARSRLARGEGPLTPTQFWSDVAEIREEMSGYGAPSRRRAPETVRQTLRRAAGRRLRRTGRSAAR